MENTDIKKTKLVWQVKYSWDQSKWYDATDEWYEEMKDATANQYRQVESVLHKVYAGNDKWTYEYLTQVGKDNLKRINRWHQIV